MADWRQIQARIRKAKNSPDASSKLSELYQRTRDAMVAWELGAIEEKNGHNEEAGRWYIISAQRFRRADWKKKAEEALARLGIELPPPGAEPPPAPERSRSTAREETESVVQLPVVGEISDLSTDEENGTADASTAAAETGSSTSNETGAKKKRRRGRRGGRGRHRKGKAAAAPGLPNKAFTESSLVSRLNSTRAWKDPLNSMRMRLPRNILRLWRIAYRVRYLQSDDRALSTLRRCFRQSALPTDAPGILLSRPG